MVQGKWGALEGLIYMLPMDQRIKEFPNQNRMQWYIAGLDFGFTHPTAFVVIGYKAGKFYVVDEIYQHKMTSADIISAVMQKCRQYDIDIIYCDSSRPEIIEDLQRANLPAHDSIKDVFEGIMHIKSMIGDKQLFVNEECRYTLREFDSYIWDVKSTVKEQPLKVNDDCMDALRYALYTHSRKLGDVSFDLGDSRITEEMDW